MSLALALPDDDDDLFVPEETAFLFADAMEAARPDPPYTVSEWADKNRHLSTVASAEPGRWRTSRTPFLRAIMDDLSSYSAVERVVVMKGAQLGVSEAALNFMGYAIHHSPGPALYVMPTVGTVQKLSKTRLDPMIAASPALSERIRPARSRDSGNTTFQKDFDGGTLILTGANSAAGLRSMPIRYLALDEVDGYPASADEEGDPVMLAIKRTANFVRRKIFMLSTPATKGYSRIGKAFREGDQRYYNVRCDACGHQQPITWDRIKWEKGKPETAAFVCSYADLETGEVCDHHHPEHRKTALMTEKGFGGEAEWIATASATRPDLHSYHLSSLYSPWQTWEEIVREFLAAKDDPALLQPFVNTVLGEEWEDMGGDKLDPDSLMAKREEFGNGAPDTVEGFIPDGIGLLTAGVDTQDDRLEVEVVGWGKDEESWSVDYQVFPGDPAGQEVWDQLNDYLSGRWPHRAFENGMPIAAMALDTGGHHTQSAYRFVRPNEGRRWWAIKGYSGKRPVWPRKPSRNNKGKVNLFAIGVDAAKEVITARLEKTGPGVSGAGACHFPISRDQEYFEQLTAERKRTKYVKGFPVIEWHKPDGARNEAFDVRVYAYAALQGLIVMGASLNKEVATLARKLEPLKAALRELATASPAPDEVDGDPVSQNRGTEITAAADIPKAKAKPRRKSRTVASPYM